MKIGLLTYHAAYNYGSILQAYATQKAIERLGHECYIINYRFKGQRDFYKLIRTKYGLKIFILDLIQFPVFKSKLQRQQKMEKFIADKLNITHLVSTPEEAEEFSDTYDVYLSGGDQIWSKYSSELYHEDWDWMNPYVLSFTKRKKISYATSTGSMNSMDFNNIRSNIIEYAHISVREQSTAEFLSRYLNKPIKNVLDPTLLLDSNDYLHLAKYVKHSEKYILYYTLRGYKEVYQQRKQCIELGKRLGMPIYAITPFCHFSNNHYYLNKISSGVEEFLYLINNAEIILTDSYHGTVFSLIFHKKFYSICKGWDTDYRKFELLSSLGIYDRCIKDLSSCSLDSNIDYSSVDDKLFKLRDYSLRYLLNAMED